MTFDPEWHHCLKCSERPRANLTLHKDRLWRPECLYAEGERTAAANAVATQHAARSSDTIARMGDIMASRPEAPAPIFNVDPPAGTKGGVEGLRVVDRPRPRRLKRVK